MLRKSVKTCALSYIKRLDVKVCLRMNDTILQALLEQKAAFLAVLDETTDLKSLEAAKVAALGKKGWVKQSFDLVKQAAPAEKKALAQSLNDLKTSVEAVLEAAEQRIAVAQIQAQVEAEWVDWSMPGTLASKGALHPLTIIERRCIEVLQMLGFEVAEGPEVETPFHNFDALNIPEHHPARDMQDTFWLDNNFLLRSHTSTVQIRALEQAKAEAKPLPLKIIAPGRVYRNETVDATHLACFHQFEGLWVDHDVTFAELKAVLSFTVQKIFGDDWALRFKPKFYPYTEPSIGIDIRLKDKGQGKPGPWLTILGAGMVHEHVFKNTGYDPATTKGFAFGLGISRIVAMAYGVESMRSLYESDLRVHQRLSVLGNI